jgi:hypothetical protein
MNESDVDTELPVQDELTSLKARADMLGLKYHPSISLEKLRAKVNDFVTSTGPVDDADDEALADAQPSKHAAPSLVSVQETEGRKRLRLKKDAHRLVRIRVTCMNPAKKEWPGEIFTTGNAVIGSVKKYVPFNIEDGWYVPNVIYQMINDRKCQIFVNSKSKGGVQVRSGKLIKEFSVEVLPDLTEEELKDLAQRQAMAGNIG